MSGPGDSELQTMLDEIRAQAPERTFLRFDHQDARRLGSTAAALAERDHLPIVAAVTRGQQRVFQAALA